MGKKKQSQASGLGRSIIKDRFSRKNKRIGEFSSLHTTELEDGYDWGRLNLQSVTEQSNLDDFLATAALAGTEFNAEKLNVKFIDPEKGAGLLSDVDKAEVREAQEKHKKCLKVPRRPLWDEHTTAEELDRLEKDNFLEWRRELAMLQDEEHIVMTPFEKNLEFWRQLWRVIERSDVVVQIVDARNPLLFRCEDLEVYVKEVNPEKVNMILVNKADLLSQKQREMWADYFGSIGVKVVFWSAMLETEKLKEKDEDEEGDDLEEGEEMEEDEDEEELEEGGTVEGGGVTMEEEESGESTEEENELKKGKEECCGAEGIEEDEEAENFGEGLAEAEGEVEEETNFGKEKDAAETDREVELGAGERSSEDCSATGQVHIGEHLPASVCVGDNVRGGSDGLSSQMVLCGIGGSEKMDKMKQESDSVEGASTESSYCGAVTEGNVCSSSSKDVSNSVECKASVENSGNLLSGKELIDFLKELHQGEKHTPGQTTVGLVGYPNVGKSSTINAILETKKVPVSATPGRTKHFQTLYVEPTLMLCDCPGLVMPSFVSTKAEMIISGILPIDQMRDYVQPVSLFVPRKTLEQVYGINIRRPREGEDPNRPPTAHELLSSYGYMRGFMTHKGIPDLSRASRFILKDFVKGKLQYCHPPPGAAVSEFDPAPAPPEKPVPFKHKGKAAKTAVDASAQPQGVVKSEIDDAFFAKKEYKVSSKGAHGVQGYTRKDGFTKHRPEGESSGSVSSSNVSLNEKPWKRHKNRNKKEKLRRLHTDLDKHDIM